MGMNESPPPLAAQLSDGDKGALNWFLVEIERLGNERNELMRALEEAGEETGRALWQRDLARAGLNSFARFVTLVSASEAIVAAHTILARDRRLPEALREASESQA